MKNGTIPKNILAKSEVYLQKIAANIGITKL